MSKLYLQAKTDINKAVKTAKANKNISVAMGFDEKNISKKIYATLIREGDDITFEVEGGDPFTKMLVCRGTIKDGIKECQPYTWAGPYPWLNMKRK